MSTDCCMKINVLYKLKCVKHMIAIEGKTHSHTNEIFNNYNISKIKCSFYSVCDILSHINNTLFNKERLWMGIWHTWKQ